MSGPKIVRIRTREEVLASCRSSLARLDEALSTWLLSVERLGKDCDCDIQATTNRRNQFATMLEEGRFDELERELPIEIAFLHESTAENVAKSILLAAQARKLKRQLSESATTVLNELIRMNLEIPNDVCQALELAKSGDGNSSDHEAAIRNALFLIQSLANSATNTLSEHQRQLAANLQTDSAAVTFAEWRDRHIGSDSQDGREAKIDRYISELEILGETSTAAAFAQKVHELKRDVASGNRSIQLDSVILDLAASSRVARERDKMLVYLRELRGELLCLGEDDTSDVLSSIDSALARTNTDILMTTLELAKSTLDARRKTIAAVSRRHSVLTHLASLGYEVREGMETAWAKNGKIVLANTALAGYGVEVGTVADSDRMQVRAVAFSAERDCTRDRDAETIWCGDFSQLQASLQEAGGSLIIERAQAIGAVPLKVVESESMPSRAASKQRVQG